MREWEVAGRAKDAEKHAAERAKDAAQIAEMAAQLAALREIIGQPDEPTTSMDGAHPSIPLAWSANGGGHVGAQKSPDDEETAESMAAESYC